MNCKGSETLQYAPFTTVEAHSEGCGSGASGGLPFSSGLRQLYALRLRLRLRPLLQGPWYISCSVLTMSGDIGQGSNLSTCCKCAFFFMYRMFLYDAI